MGGAGIGYHYYITKDGTIWEGRPDNTVGAHASGGNSDSIGICFEGDYDVERTMPDAQKKAGKELVYHRKTSLRWKIRVATHQKWLTRDARVGTLAKGVNLLGNK